MAQTNPTNAPLPPQPQPPHPPPISSGGGVSSSSGTAAAAAEEGSSSSSSSNLLSNLQAQSSSLTAAISEMLPTPATTAAVTSPGEKEVSQLLSEAPTESHALATADHEEKGHAQRQQVDRDDGGDASGEGPEQVVDLGWNEPQQNIASPLVGGLPNEELWVLVRRFNKQMYHVKEFPYPVPGNLDLNIAEDEEFSPDKLRSNLERLYMTVGIGVLGTVKHIARLRSWREARRTAWFCTAYFAAWALDFLVPLLVAVVLALIVYPKARGVLFPPAPIALVDSSTGGVQKPKSGVLGSTDSATGAPENHKGEAVEQEASNFVNGVASIALASVAGKHPQGEPDAGGDPAQDAAPDPTSLAISAADAKDKAAGAKPSEKHDKTKVPMETAMWTKMRPIMHGIGDLTDGWERLGNALSPTPPFPKNRYRLRLAALVVPVLCASMVVTSYMVMKGITFGVGFGFFGDPIISRGIHLLNTKFPNWQKVLEIRNTILKGVPTNAQLTVTLLRIGEANNAPIPPPPRKDEPPPEEPADISEEHLRATGADWPLSATKEELDEAMAFDPATKHQTDGHDIDASKATKHGKKGSRILGFFKGTTKATVNTALGADKLKAKAGSEPSKKRLGVIPRPGEDMTSGPVEFKSRYHGKKGHVYLMSKAGVPYVAFSTDSSIEKQGVRGRDVDLHPVWSVPVGEIKELKKVGGFGWKAKLIVGWALDRQVTDGLEIVDKRGNVWDVTAMPLRDELFNRLIAMGGQKWEAW